MDKPRPFLPPLIILLVIALAALWYVNLEWEEHSIDLGPTPEARRNQVLALQRLLEQREKPVELVRSFAGIGQLRFGSETVGAGDALVLLNTGRALRDAQVDALWKWVEAGGRLFVTVDNPYFDVHTLHDDPLLRRLGLTLVDGDWDTSDDATAKASNNKPVNPSSTEADSAESDEDSGTDTGENPAAAKTPAENACRWRSTDLPVEIPEKQWTDLRMKFHFGVAFEDAKSITRPLAAQNEHIFLAHLNVGAGEIFAFPSMGPLGNDMIMCQDNAFVLWHLLRDRNKVWLVLNTNSPSFWNYLWHLSALGCLALLATLALWLWYKVPRFGPILERPMTGRRQFLDHIQAAAHFLVRHQGTEALVEPLREELRQRLRTRHPGFFHLSVDDQIARLTQLSGMTPGDIQLALYHPLPVQDAVFIDIVQRLQHLRNSL